MTESMKKTLPDMVNYYPLEVDGYLLAFGNSTPKFEEFIMDMDTNMAI